jgi:hypothetical protein
MASRPRHTDKEVEDAVAYAESLGWRVESGSNHAKFKLFCPRSDRSGCIIFVWSTPKNAGNHARAIVRAIDRCNCGDDDE